MRVKDSVPMGNGHSIEFGEATWDPSTQSVRNRYDTPNGRFSPHGSSEIPLSDLVPILTETAKRDLLDIPSAAQIIEALSTSIIRQSRSSLPSAPTTVLSSTQSEEAIFHKAMLEIHKRAKSEANYNATRFFQMVADQGGIDAARMLLHSSTVSDGYTALWERGRLDLTVEHLVLQPRWESLFTEEERHIARSRLKEYGFETV